MIENRLSFFENDLGLFESTLASSNVENGSKLEVQIIEIQDLSSELDAPACMLINNDSKVYLADRDYGIHRIRDIDVKNSTRTLPTLEKVFEQRKKTGLSLKSIEIREEESCSLPIVTISDEGTAHVSTPSMQTFCLR